MDLVASRTQVVVRLDSSFWVHDVCLSEVSEVSSRGLARFSSLRTLPVRRNVHAIGRRRINSNGTLPQALLQLAAFFQRKKPSFAFAQNVYCLLHVARSQYIIPNPNCHQVELKCYLNADVGEKLESPPNYVKSNQGKRSHNREYCRKDPEVEVSPELPSLFWAFLQQASQQ